MNSNSRHRGTWPSQKAYFDKMGRWKAELRSVALSFDVAGFKKFYNKWKEEGVYTRPLTCDDKIIEIALRQIVCGLKDVPEGKVIEAQLWLISKGYNPYPWNNMERLWIN